MKPGLYPDMPTREYFADPCPQPSLTQSIAKVLVERSPAHAYFRHPRFNPAALVEDTEYDKRLAIGNAAHKLVLGRGKDIVVIEADNFRTKEAQKTRDTVIAEGKVPILAKHHLSALALSYCIHLQIKQAGCVDAFGLGQAEVAMIAQDGNIWLRSLVDWMTPNPFGTMMYDLKTGGVSAAPHAIPHRLADQGWDIQAAMQERILDIIDPNNRGKRRFRFVAVEQDEPFGLTVNELSESVMEMGRRKLAFAIDRWRYCMERGVWPSYEPIVHLPQYPAYAEAQWLNREIEEAAGNRHFDPEVVLAG